MKRIRLILVDDQQAVREGVGLILERQDDLRVVGQAGTGVVAQQLVRDQKPDLVLTEVYLPDCTGVELTRCLLKSHPGLRVLAFTGVEDPAAMEAMLGAHAAGYVLKRCSGTELIDAIRSVRAGERYCDPGLAGQVLGRPVSRDGAPGERRMTPLSDQEMSVLRLVAWGYTSKETAARLRLSVKTVETYRARFQRKLRINSRPALVRYALLEGWLKVSSPPA